VHTTEPRLDERPERRYAGVRTDVTMDEMAEAIPTLIEEVEAWLAARGVAPAGAPFVRYHVIDMAGPLDIEVGFPVDEEVVGDGRVGPGALPAGRYASLVYIGAENGIAGNAALIDWAAEAGIAWDAYESPRGHGFRGRVETFLSDPAEEPDPARWRTEVAILVASRRAAI
jgi:effector-binding domain-containing protein